MPPRQYRSAPVARKPVAPFYSGPQAMPASSSAYHAPNAALLIDFDNVTMGIRSDLQQELRNLLSTDIIKGKVAVQRAYADWRRYPQYIVPLTESSIDLIFAPAYGSSKKNATDIRLAIDALELVFTRPEIGTFILLSGDSDFSSLVIKLKEYGKYVIGVGIRESSSDLLVMNCDEYYSYNALAGLVKSDEEESTRWDPWELVTEALNRMKRNGDVMRSDRLKQVMQEIDANFDEKNLGMAKFSRFVQEAQQRGLIRVSKLESGQLEVDLPVGTSDGDEIAVDTAAPAAAATRERTSERERDRDRDRGRRGRRGRGGRDRDRDRTERDEEHEEVVAGSVDEVAPDVAADEVEAAAIPAQEAPAPRTDGKERPDFIRDRGRGRAPAPAQASFGFDAPLFVAIGVSGPRLTRSEAFDLVKSAVESIVTGDETTSASAVRRRAFELLGRDSESLSERGFERILRDAHDAEMIDLRRRGNDYEVARVAEAAPITEQLNRAEQAHAAQVAASQPAAPPAPRGMSPRGVTARPAAARGKAATLPADLLMVGVVGPASTAAANNAAPATASAPEVVAEETATTKDTEPASAESAPAEDKPAKRGKRAAKTAKKSARKTTAKKASKRAAKTVDDTSSDADSTSSEAAAEGGDNGGGAATATAKKAARKSGAKKAAKRARTTKS